MLGLAFRFLFVEAYRFCEIGLEIGFVEDGILFELADEGNDDISFWVRLPNMKFAQLVMLRCNWTAGLTAPSVPM